MKYLFFEPTQGQASLTVPSEKEIENLFFYFFRTQGNAGFAYKLKQLQHA